MMMMMMRIVYVTCPADNKVCDKEKGKIRRPIVGGKTPMVNEDGRGDSGVNLVHRLRTAGIFVPSQVINAVHQQKHQEHYY